MLMPSIAGGQPQLCRSAGGNPSSRSLRSQGRHSDGNATAPPDSAAFPVVFPGCYVFTTHSLRCGCAGRSYRSHSTSQLLEIMGARRTARTRRVHPASSWHQSRTGMSQSCAPKHPSNLLHSDGKRASGWAHTRLELGAASAGRSVRTGKQHGRCALHAGCMCAAFGCRVASRKPLPAARLCGTTAIVRPWIRHGMPLETRTRATRMHAEYGWPCYAARLRPRSTGLGWWAQVNFQALQHDPET